MLVIAINGYDKQFYGYSRFPKAKQPFRFEKEMVMPYEFSMVPLQLHMYRDTWK
jgi:hypothetical protein